MSVRHPLQAVDRIRKEGENMTESELRRLDELDKIISWDNDADGGRSLTEDELTEHNRLAIKLLQESKQLEGIPED